MFEIAQTVSLRMMVFEWESRFSKYGITLARKRASVCFSLPVAILPKVLRAGTSTLYRGCPEKLD